MLHLAKNNLFGQLFISLNSFSHTQRNIVLQFSLNTEEDIPKFWENCEQLILEITISNSSYSLLDFVLPEVLLQYSVV